MNDPFALLKKDHREAEALLKTLAEAKPGPRRRAAIEKLEVALTRHMQIEEQLIYPLIPKNIGDEEATEATTEHKLARKGLSDMAKLADEPGFGAAVAMLTAGIKHHVQEEEHEIFPELKGALGPSAVAELGDEVAAAKAAARRSPSPRRPRTSASSGAR